METVDGVVVVGGGSVGLLTALKLGQAGVRVVVLEADSGVSPSSRAVAFLPTTLAGLDQLGLLDDIRKRAVMCPDVAYRRGDGSLIAKMHWDVLAEDTQYPYALLLGQNHVSSILVEHLRALPNVEIRWNHRAEAVEQDDCYVTLRTSSPGGQTWLRSPWVAAADGAQSTMREQIGLELGGSHWPERMVALDVFYDFTLHGYSRANFIHDPVDWAFVVQLDQSGLWRVCYEESSSLSDAQIRQRVPERLTRLLPGAPTPDQYRVEHFAPYQVSQCCVAEFRRGRVLLAGDAAHVTNPMGGLAMSGGVLEAVHLGEALINVIKENGALSVLDEYAVSRRQTFQAFTSTRSTAYFTWMKESGWIQRTRDLAMFKRVGSDRDVMREFLLQFDKLNGRRSRSLTSRIRLVTGMAKRLVNVAAKSMSDCASAAWQTIKSAHKRLLRDTSIE